MSSFDVRIHQVTIHPHPNADALELAQVGGFRAVVAKGAYVTGDFAVYIPEAAVLPEELIEELGLTGRLAGAKKDRVKAIRLRGELSQGIVCRPSWFPAATWEGEWCSCADHQEALGRDYAEDLGIAKYAPPVPVHLAGQVKPCPDFVPMFDIENIKKFPDMFTPGQEVVATEKIHGTNVGITYVPATGEFAVSSKGMGAKHLALQESEGNTYWRAVRASGIEAALKYVAFLFPSVEKWAVYGEVFGAGIQDLPYGFKGADGPQLRIFDIKIDSTIESAGAGSHFLDWGNLHRIVGHMNDASPTTRVQVVPVVYRGPYDYDLLAAEAEGDSMFDRSQIREGLVVRAVEELLVSSAERQAKFISSRYLLRKGTKGAEPTEFE